MGSKFGVRMDAVVAEEMTMGGLDIAMITREVDIYLRAGQIPQVVVRPIMERLEAVLEGASIVVSPEVAGMLEEMGWVPPEVAGPMKDALETSRAHHTQCGKRIASMEEDLAQAHGKLADLELANQGLQDELADTSRAMPYT